MPRATELWLSTNGFIALPTQPDPGPAANSMWAAFISNGCEDDGLQTIATIAETSETALIRRTWLFRHVKIPMTVDATAVLDNKFVFDFGCFHGSSELVVSHTHGDRIDDAQIRSEEDFMARFSFHPDSYTECTPYQRKKYVIKAKSPVHLTVCIKHQYEDGFVDVTGLDILVKIE